MSVQIVDEPVVFVIYSNVFEQSEEAFVADSIKRFLINNKADIDVLLMFNTAFAKHPHYKNGVPCSSIRHKTVLALGDLWANP